MPLEPPVEGIPAELPDEELLPPPLSEDEPLLELLLPLEPLEPEEPLDEPLLPDEELGDDGPPPESVLQPPTISSAPTSGASTVSRVGVFIVKCLYWQCSS
jgi:hypothetical protein